MRHSSHFGVSDDMGVAMASEQAGLMSGCAMVCAWRGCGGVSRVWRARECGSAGADGNFKGGMICDENDEGKCGAEAWLLAGNEPALDSTLWAVLHCRIQYTTKVCHRHQCNAPNFKCQTRVSCCI